MFGRAGGPCAPPPPPFASGVEATGTRPRRLVATPMAGADGGGAPSPRLPPSPPAVRREGARRHGPPDRRDARCGAAVAASGALVRRVHGDAPWVVGGCGRCPAGSGWCRGHNRAGGGDGCTVGVAERRPRRRQRSWRYRYGGRRRRQGRDGGGGGGCSDSGGGGGDGSGDGALPASCGW